MRKYIIDKSVNTESPNLRKAILKAGVYGRKWQTQLVALAAAFGIDRLNAFVDNSVYRIKSEQELKTYRNYHNTYWKSETIYIEHPCYEHLLIEASTYKRNVIREMVADIQNYITDNLCVKKLVVGLIFSGAVDGENSVDIKECNSSSTIKVNLDRDFLFTMKDAEPRQTERKYTWIDQFPQIKSAVEHNAVSYESVETITEDVNVESGIARYLSAKFNSKRHEKIYIMYDCTLNQDEPI